VLTAANAAGAKEHAGPRDTRFLVTHLIFDQRCLIHVLSHAIEFFILILFLLHCIESPVIRINEYTKAELAT
jgi:hypothetical protein